MDVHRGQSTHVPPVDETALQTLHDRYGGTLLGFALMKTGGDRAVAEEVVHDTMLRVARNVDPDTLVHDPRPLLFTVACRLIGQRRRARQGGLGPMAETMDGSLPAFKEIGRLQRAAAVEKALGALGYAQRQVVVEVYFRGRTVEAVARTLGVSPETVKWRAHHALRALREVLSRPGVDVAA